MDDLDALLHGTLERLAAEDQAHASGALVDDRRAYRLRQVGLAARSTARIDQARAACVAVQNLVAGEVDRVVRRQLVVDEVMTSTAVP